MNILVAGGCGFIGSHLVEYLIQNRHSVTVIDDLSSGYASNLSSSWPVEEFLKARIEDVNLSKLGQFDGVFHLAAQASVPISIENFYKSSSTNPSVKLVIRLL